MSFKPRRLPSKLGRRRHEARDPSGLCGFDGEEFDAGVYRLGQSLEARLTPYSRNLRLRGGKAGGRVGKGGSAKSMRANSRPGRFGSADVLRTQKDRIQFRTVDSQIEGRNQRSGTKSRRDDPRGETLVREKRLVLVTHKSFRKS